MIYNKLVRDKIPEIIRSGGESPCCCILEDMEYLQALEAKLDEGTAEFHRDKTVEELADILEVVFALAEAHRYSREDLMSVYEAKHNARGGFRKRVFLISKE